MSMQWFRRLLLSAVISLFAFGSTAFAQWELVYEKGENGEDFTVLEQLGYGGSFFSLVCIEKEISIEIFYSDFVSKPLDNAQVMLAVLGFEPIRLAGFTDRVDEEFMVFIGIDLRGYVSQGTEALIQQMTQADVMGMVVLDEATGEYISIEEWDLIGIEGGLRDLFKACA